jgi:hypothetical protein
LKLGQGARQSELDPEETSAASESCDAAMPWRPRTVSFTVPFPIQNARWTLTFRSAMDIDRQRRLALGCTRPRAGPLFRVFGYETRRP